MFWIKQETGCRPSSWTYFSLSLVRCSVKTLFTYPFTICISLLYNTYFVTIVKHMNGMMSIFHMPSTRGVVLWSETSQGFFTCSLYLLYTQTLTRLGRNRTWLKRWSRCLLRWWCSFYPCCRCFTKNGLQECKIACGRDCRLETTG